MVNGYHLSIVVTRKHSEVDFFLRLTVNPIELLLFSLTHHLHHLSGRSTLGMSLIHDWKFCRLLFPLGLENSSEEE